MLCISIHGNEMAQLSVFFSCTFSAPSAPRIIFATNSSPSSHSSEERRLEKIVELLGWALAYALSAQLVTFPLPKVTFPLVFFYL